VARPPETIQQDGRGRILSKRQFSKREQVFLRHYLSNGYDGKAAAAVAGYLNPDQDSWQILRRKDIRLAIHEAEAVQIKGMVRLSLKAIREVLESTPLKATDRKLKAETAFRVLDRAGHMPTHQESSEAPHERDLSDLSIEELTAIVDRELARKAGDHAKVIDGQAVEVQDSAQSAAPSIAKLLIHKG